MAMATVRLGSANANQHDAQEATALEWKRQRAGYLRSRPRRKMSPVTSLDRSVDSHNPQRVDLSKRASAARGARRLLEHRANLPHVNLLARWSLTLSRSEPQNTDKLGRLHGQIDGIFKFGAHWFGSFWADDEPRRTVYNQQKYDKYT